MSASPTANPHFPTRKTFNEGKQSRKTHKNECWRQPRLGNVPFVVLPCHASPFTVFLAQFIFQFPNYTHLGRGWCNPRRALCHWDRPLRGPACLPTARHSSFPYPYKRNGALQPQRHLVGMPCRCRFHQSNVDARLIRSTLVAG